MSEQNCRADPFQCQRWRDRLKTSSVDQLPSEERTALWSHMQACRHCFDVYTYTLYTGASVVTPRTAVGVSARAGHMVTRTFSRFMWPVLHKPRKLLAASLMILTLWSFSSFAMAVLIDAVKGPLTTKNLSDVSASSLALQRTLPVPHSGATWVHTVAWSPNKLYIGVLWDDSTLQILNAGTSRVIFSTEVGWGNGLAWSPDSQWIAATGRTGNTVEIWNIATPAHGLYTKHTAQITAIAWSPDSVHDLVASASSDGNVRIWNAHTGKTFFSFQDTVAGSDGVTALAWSPNGRRLVLGDSAGNIQIWDVFAKTYIKDYPGHIKGGITSVSWSSDNTSIVSASYDGKVRIWEVEKDVVDLLFSPCSNGGPVLAVFWKPIDNTYLGLACYDGSVQIWSVTGWNGRITRQRAAVYQESTPTIGVFTISWSPQGDQLVVGGPGIIFRVEPKK